ncbi:hypothetical protein [Chryseobacterium sp.]|uniref:hypothetical protein n=1 Tax=Chryseobacterium sp. TaxID=1871047 RepID=UPI00289BA849|nr:hypothetical protein [Chryseobacterium sp.]
MKPFRITNESTNRKYKMNIDKIKYQINALQNGSHFNYGNHLTYSKKTGNEMFIKLQEAGVNCTKRLSKYKENAIDIIFNDVPYKST